MTVYNVTAVSFKDCCHCCQDRFSDSVVAAVRIIFVTVLSLLSG